MRSTAQSPNIFDTVPIVDVDSHVSEPPDLWTARMSKKKWGDQIPHLEFDPQLGMKRWRVGKYLLTPDAKLAMAGWTDYPPAHPPSLEQADRGSWDPHARLKRMDEYGIYAQVLYPNVIAFAPEAFIGLPDPSLSLECVSAYNDFIVDFAKADPNRLLPIMSLPFWDVEASEREAVRAAKSGHKGVLFAAHYSPVGLPPIWDSRWDRLLHVIEDLGLSVNFHTGFGTFNLDEVKERANARTGDEHTRLTSVGMLDNAHAIADVICTGLCARFPKLNFVSVESGAGWLLYMLESLDWHWKAYGGLRDHRDRELPSFYFRRQVFGSFWYENASARAVAENLADNLMFETDFPHPTSLSPGPASPAGRPRDMVESALTGLPDEVIGKILWKNAAKLYGVNMPPAFASGSTTRTAA